MIISDKVRDEYFKKLSSKVENNERGREVPTEDSTIIVTPDYSIDDYIEDGVTTTGTNGISSISQAYVNSISNAKFSRADLQPEAFDRLIWQKGFKTIWEKATLCTCLDDKSRQPDYSCSYCKGKGYLYIEPRYTRVLVTSISGNREQEATGLEDKGAMYLTPLSIDTVGFRDRFTFPEFTVRFSDLVIKGRDEVKYPIKQIIGIYRNGKEVDKSKYSVTYNSNIITWEEGFLEENSKYSVLYLSNPVYIAIKPIHELRGTYLMKNGGGKDYFVRLPSQFQMKREDMIDNA